nr:6339_t:CDS:2 [Entrophospora candida]CAG8554275.1 10879_t:CDS:2 [Entrophospora candida]
MNLDELWSEYKSNRDGDHYTDNASVIFVPTASGARGYDAVRQFLAKAYDPRVLKITERPVYRTIGTDSVVEEAEITILFVSGDGAWIVPGVDSRHTIDNKVVIPMVTSALYEGDRISSIRVYWDQASVLKQLKLISEKSPWPVLTDKQVDALINPPNVHLNPFSKNLLSAGLSLMNSNAQMKVDEQIEQQQPRRNIHTSSRVSQPGGTGGKSSIVFSHDTEDPAAGRTRYNSNKNASHFSIGENDNDDNVSEAGSITGSSKRRGKSQFESGVEFGTNKSEHSTRRILKPPESQITFG